MRNGGADYRLRGWKGRREESCNKVRAFRWLSSKGSLTTSPLLVCPSLFFLSLSSLSFRLGKTIHSTTLFRSSPLSPLPNPSLPLYTPVSRRKLSLQKRGGRKRRRKQQQRRPRRRHPLRKRDRRAILDLRHPDRPRLPSPVAQACRSRKSPQANNNNNNKLRCLGRCRPL